MENLEKQFNIAGLTGMIDSSPEEVPGGITDVHGWH